MQNLRERLLALSEQVAEAVRSSAQAMIHQQEAPAREVGLRDAHLNTVRFDIEEDAYAILSAQTLDGTDVRRVVGVIMVTQALEQIGDCAANVAHMVVRMQRQNTSGESAAVFACIDEMASTAVDMIQEACKAFVDRDARRAEATVRRDQELIDAFERVNAILTLPAEHTGVTPERSVLMMWAAHNLHQIGTHAINICERAIFLATGELKDFH